MNREEAKRLLKHTALIEAYANDAIIEYQRPGELEWEDIIQLNFISDPALAEIWVDEFKDGMKIVYPDNLTAQFCGAPLTPLQPDYARRVDRVAVRYREVREDEEDVMTNAPHSETYANEQVAGDNDDCAANVPNGGDQNGAERAMSALLRERDVLRKAMDRCYRMLLSEPDTRGALFKAENILREALAETAITGANQ